jgi:choline kinase
MNYVILAAGQGRRLGELTKEIPKCMLMISEDHSLATLQITKIMKADSNASVVIMHGFSSDKLEKHVSDRGYDGKVEFIYNPFFIEANNIYSFYLAVNYFKDDFILVNSDVIFPIKWLEDLCSSQKTSVIVETQRGVTDESMKTYVDRTNRIVQFSKKKYEGKVLGEYVGLARINKKDIPVFEKVTRKMLQDGKVNCWYEDSFNVFMNHSEICGITEANPEWIEIDDEYDYRNAMKIAAIGDSR